MENIPINYIYTHPVCSGSNMKFVKFDGEFNEKIIFFCLTCQEEFSALCKGRHLKSGEHILKNIYPLTNSDANFNRYL